jgi:sugar O-acyltransferase (sialic acid O-acetyltransferase NeuD family)
MQKLVIIGGSNAFWEISELIQDINKIENRYEIIAVLDDNTGLIGNKFNNLIVDGPIEKVKDFDNDVKFIFAIGSFKTRLIRENILKRINIPEDRFETLIHPNAKIFSNARIGHGCIIHYGTVIFNHTIIDSFCVIAANCVIAVSNYIGKGALFGSNITTTTGVKVGSYSFIGSSTSIGEFVTIGPGAQIGMASLILKDIPSGAFVLGSPPRMLDKVEVSISILKDWEQKIIEINKK